MYPGFHIHGFYNGWQIPLTITMSTAFVSFQTELCRPGKKSPKLITYSGLLVPTVKMSELKKESRPYTPEI